MRLIGKGVGYAAMAAALFSSGFLGALPASANTYDVTFVGANFDVNALITTQSTLDSWWAAMTLPTFKGRLPH